MGDHQDVQHRGRNAVYQRIWKADEKEPAEFVVKMRSEFRMLP
jgi:hypothetical protein